jgi:hypothetical protein
MTLTRSHVRAHWQRVEALKARQAIVIDAIRSHDPLTPFSKRGLLHRGLGAAPVALANRYARICGAIATYRTIGYL